MSFVNTEGAAYLVTTVDQTDGEVINTEVSYTRLCDALRTFQITGQVPVAVALIEPVAVVQDAPAPSLIPSIDEAVARGMLAWADEPSGEVAD